MSLCYLCERTRNKVPHLDTHHILPRRLGGLNQDYDIMVLCRQCHSVDKSLSVDFKGRNNCLLVGLWILHKDPRQSASLTDNGTITQNPTRIALVFSFVEITYDALTFLSSHTNQLYYIEDLWSA
jgi:hypothetical protein